MPGYSSQGIDVVGYHDVDGRPVFKLAMQVVNDRWYLYASHFWEPRLSIIDVTDPSSMELVGMIEGPPNTATWQVQVADGLLVEGLEHRRTGARGVHRNHYTGGRYVHLAASQPGFEGNVYGVLDIEDPKTPHLAGRWFMPEQFVVGGARSARRRSSSAPTSPRIGAPR